MKNIVLFLNIHTKLIVLSLLLTSSTFFLHAQQFQLFYIDELIPPKTDTDSSLIFLESKLKEATFKQDTATEIKYLLATSSFNRFYLDYNISFDCAGKALILAEEYNNLKLQAQAHENFGILSFLFQQYELAAEHFNHSLRYYQAAIEKGQVSKSDLFYPNYYLILYNRHIKQQAQLDYYIETCSELLKTTELDPTFEIYLEMERARNHRLVNNFSEAEAMLLLLIERVENLEKDSTKNTYKENLGLQLYARTARLYEKEGHEKLTGTYFKKAVKSIKLNGNQAFFMAHVYAGYGAWLFRHGDYYNAYLNNDKARRINDRYQGARRLVNQGFLSVRDHYSEELQEKNKEINQQNLELAESKQEILRTRIILVIILFLIVLAAIVIRNRIQQQKHRKEKEITQKREQEAKELLELRNREITASMLQLIEKEETINAVREFLKNNNDNLKTIKFLDSLKKQSVSLWDAFNNRFTEQNKDFYERLQKTIPNLSSNDLKLCALIKLNFSGKEMSSLLGISTASLHVARHRLRKKMNIERSVDLFEFINSL